MIKLTCFPVNPWHMTLVSLSTQTFALADICLTPFWRDALYFDATESDRTATRELIIWCPEIILLSKREVLINGSIIVWKGIEMKYRFGSYGVVGFDETSKNRRKHPLLLESCVYLFPFVFWWIQKILAKEYLSYVEVRIIVSDHSLIYFVLIFYVAQCKNDKPDDDADDFHSNYRANLEASYALHLSSGRKSPSTKCIIDPTQILCMTFSFLLHSPDCSF